MEYKHEKYDEFIQNILNTRGRFNIPKEEYKERHHIIPKCVGGSNDKDNLIDLYAKEHFIAHKLLAEENPTNWGLVNALNRMTFSKQPNGNSYIATPDEYEEVRILLSEANSARLVDLWATMPDSKRAEICENISKGLTGKISPRKGLTKDNCLACKKQSETIKGHAVHENTINALHNTKGEKYLWKDGVKIRVKPWDVQAYLDNGWSTKGPKTRQVTNGVETKRVLESEVDQWLSKGYRIGHNHKTSNGGGWKRGSN